MPYQDEFVLFWEQVKQSVQEGRFAKLTMAKTIGKQELKNIFVRPLDTESDFNVLVKVHYRPKETEDKEQELTLDQTFEFLKGYLLKPFLSVILFTTTKDVTFKVNKKGAGSITENAPTFRDVILAKRDI
ncbi:hypothetical protein KO494_00120 [Lacinutrix sp. C3R15]|uniref:hypothetical protein n=1 Tax=Flavobacteriaceae TaxID=49546 RepID=UPI001C0997A3|nr:MULTISPECIES: hypothetical protein [Flavobacteriaceae]MBU2937931.1 hypothetical protein [Lacinutrix sp. C3R15]MDO6621245.1 hypothetical protein [Oceanihabitans sp. 1_MG-2023]